MSHRLAGFRFLPGTQCSILRPTKGATAMNCRLCLTIILRISTCKVYLLNIVQRMIKDILIIASCQQYRFWTSSLSRVVPQTKESLRHFLPQKISKSTSESSSQLSKAPKPPKMFWMSKTQTKKDQLTWDLGNQCIWKLQKEKWWAALETQIRSKSWKVLWSTK